MVSCPHCHQPIPESAVRCRYCRRPLTSSKRSPLLSGLLFTALDRHFADEPPSRRRWIEAPLLFAAFFIGAWWIRGQELGFGWVEWMNEHFSFFIREPLLQSYVYIFVETFALKLGLVILIVLYLFFVGNPWSGLWR